MPLVTNFKSAIKYDTSKTILCNDTWFVLQRTILGLIKRSLPRDSLYTDEMFLSHLCEQVKTVRKCWTHFARQTHQLAPRWWSKGRGGRMDEWVAVRKGKWARDRGDGSQNKEVLSHQDKGTGAQIRKHLQIQMHVGTGTRVNLCRSLCSRGSSGASRVSQGSSGLSGV